MIRTRRHRYLRSVPVTRESPRRRTNNIRNDESCIDLTATPDDSFVDLTDVDIAHREDDSLEITSQQGANDNSVVIIETPDASPTQGRRRQRYHNRIQNRLEILDNDDDDSIDLPPAPFAVETSPRPSTSSNLESPEPIRISCPVCFDDDKMIKRDKRKLMSTVCGHLFCNTCISASVRAQRACPVCRKKLTLSQLHVLHI